MVNEPVECKATALDPMELVEDGAESEINALFRRKLSGLRHMAPQERQQALRAARQWRALALKALRDKRAASRHDRYMARRLQTPGPG